MKRCRDSPRFQRFRVPEVPLLQSVYTNLSPLRGTTYLSNAQDRGGGKSEEALKKSSNSPWRYTGDQLLF